MDIADKSLTSEQASRRVRLRAALESEFQNPDSSLICVLVALLNQRDGLSGTTGREIVECLWGEAFEIPKSPRESRNSEISSPALVENVQCSINPDLGEITPETLFLQSKQLLFSQSKRWHIIGVYEDEIHFIPRALLDILPAIGSEDRKGFSPQCWINFWLYCEAGSITVGANAGPTTQPKLRRAILKRLCENREEFGFSGACTTDEWSTLIKKKDTVIYDCLHGQKPDMNAALNKLSAYLDSCFERMARAGVALEPILQNGYSV